MAKVSNNIIRLPIFSYFEGVNMSVGENLGKPGELSYATNARCKMIGTIEKREGTRRLGNSITATDNHDIFFFENTTATSTGFFRISTVSSLTSIYYLNTSAEWTTLSGLGTYIYELGTSTSQFDITNPSGSTFRYTWDTNGTDPNIDHHLRVGSSVVVNAQNFSAGNKGTFTVTGVAANYFEVTNASGVVEGNKTIGTGSITVAGLDFSHTVAEDCLFLVNGNNSNMYISSNGTTVVDDATATGHLYGSPRAYKINAYKNKLYLADYIDAGGTRHKNGIMMSSEPVGIIALVDGDHPAASCEVGDEIKVTDTKYIQAADTLDVYRGGTKIADITTSAKSEDTFTILTISFAGGYTTLNSSDEIWVDGTFNGTKVFRWATSSGGVNVKQYDTMAISGCGNDRIKMVENINNVQVFGTNNNLAVWNNSSLQPVDVGVGCVSDNGYVKNGVLFFIHYTGVYIFDGSSAPKNISAKIQPYIDGASKTVLEASAAGKKGMSVFFTLSSTTLYYPDGSVKKTLSDVVLEYNLQTTNWFVHTGIKAHRFATYSSTTNADRLEFASSETGYHIMEFLTGQLDDTITSDKEIPFRADSNNITLCKNFENFAYPIELVVETERGSGIECFVSLDEKKFYQVKSDFVKGCVIAKINNKDDASAAPPRCRKIKISLRDNTKKLCRISRVALRYKQTEEEEEVHQVIYEN